MMAINDESNNYTLVELVQYDLLKLITKLMLGVEIRPCLSLLSSPPTHIPFDDRGGVS
jgi:hypothetical protein